ncbi:MAG: CHAT domain-containing protein [Saprospiraceae bacterium]|nr:CHAT domain-containing protein [Saprospiraceae bacterium]
MNQYKHIAIFIFSLIGLILFFRIVNFDNQHKKGLDTVIDYIHREGINKVFYKADELKYSGDFENAADRFIGILDHDLSQQERIYCINQIVYCYLWMNEDSLALNYLNEIDSLIYCTNNNEGDWGDFYFNKGLLRYHQIQNNFVVENQCNILMYFQFAMNYHLDEYGTDHIKYGTCLNQIGLFYYEYGQTLDSAQFYILPAYDLFEKHVEWKAFSIENEFGMALLNLSQRDHRPGEAHVENALNLLNNASYKNDIFLAKCLNLKANLLKKQKKNIQADSIYKKAITLVKNKNNHLVLEVYSNWIINLCRFNLSEQDFNNIFDTIQVFNSDSFGNKYRLYGYYFFGKDDKRSIRYYNEFLQKYSKSQLKDRNILSEIFYSLGNSYEAIGEFDSAFYSFKTNMLNGVEIKEEEISVNDLMKPKFHRMKRFNFRLYGEMANVYLNKYKKFAREEDILISYRLYQLADSLSVIQSQNEDAILTYQKDAGDEFYESALEACYLMGDNSKSVLDQAFLFSEKMKSYILYRDMLQIRDSLDVETSLMESKIYFFEKLKKRYILTENQIKEYSNLIEKLKSHLSNLNKAIPLENTLKIDFVKEFLKPSQTLINFTYGSKWIHLIFINKDTTVFLQLPNEKIEENINEFRDILTDNSNGQIADFYRTSHFLFKKLLSPVSDLIGKDTLIIIRDKILNLIPFEALTIGDSPEELNYKNMNYVINNTFIKYSPSWKVYVETEKVGKKISNKFHVVAFTYGSKSKFLLKNSERMLDSLAYIFKNGKIDIFKNEKCRKSIFFDKSKKCDILHFSLHALSISRNDQLWENMLLFNPTKVDGDTLFGYEIFKTHLDAKLVVLGTCLSAFGPSDYREGVYSITRYFTQAGVPSVISSLWEIDENRTACLLSLFYSELARSSSPSSALYQAKIKYLRNTDEFMANPVYWSGIICNE